MQRHKASAMQTPNVQTGPTKCNNPTSLSNRHSHKRRSQQLCPKPRILSAVNLAVAISAIAAHVALHVGDVVELRYIAVFLHVWAFVLRHGGEEVFDDFVGDEGVAEVEFCDVRLGLC